MFTLLLDKKLVKTENFITVQVADIPFLKKMFGKVDAITYRQRGQDTFNAAFNLYSLLSLHPALNKKIITRKSIYIVQTDNGFEFLDKVRKCLLYFLQNPEY